VFEKLIDAITGISKQSDDTESPAARKKRAQKAVSRGDIASGQGDVDRAIAEYNEALRLDPGNAEAYYGRGLAYDSKDDYDRAIADLSSAISIKPDWPVAFYKRGLVYSEADKYSSAISDFSEAIRLDPNKADFFIARADAYQSSKNITAALSDLGRAISVDGRNASAFDKRGDIYYSMHDFDQAIIAYRKATLLDPSKDVYKTDLRNAIRGRNSFSFRVCNDTDGKLWFATIGLREDSSQNKIEGWWIVGPGNCREIGHFKRNSYLYWTAHDERGGSWGYNNIQYCIKQMNTIYHSDEPCDALNLSVFTEIGPNSTNNWQVTACPSPPSSEPGFCRSAKR
jgi:tetratricopeptide (TPR) repeat protein